MRKALDVLLRKVRPPRGRGFTLIELIVVVVIIGILATIGIAGYNNITARSQIAAAQANLNTIARGALAHHTFIEAQMLTRAGFDSVIDAQEGVGFQAAGLAEGPLAAAWQLLDSDDVPVTMEEFALGFDLGEGTAKHNDEGTRAVITAAAGDKLFATMIVYGSVLGGEDTVIDGELPPGATPDDVLDDPTIIDGAAGAPDLGPGTNPDPSEGDFGSLFGEMNTYSYGGEEFGEITLFEIPTATASFTLTCATDQPFPPGTSMAKVDPTPEDPFAFMMWSNDDGIPNVGRGFTCQVQALDATGEPLAQVTLSSRNDPAYDQRIVATYDTRAPGCPDQRIAASGLNAGSDLSIDWGDGTVQTGVFGRAEHTFASPGAYQVTLEGDIFWAVAPDDANCLVSVDAWDGAVTQTSMSSAYAGTHNLTSAAAAPGVESLNATFMNATVTADLSGWDLSNLTRMDLTFAGANVTSDISGWDVSRVTDFGSAFSGAQFTADLSGWDTSSAKSFYGMFEGVTDFNQDLSGWDTSSAMGMGRMFYRTSFNQDISGWSTGNVVDMAEMFAHNPAFNQDISPWDTSNVQSMHQMFMGASAFNQDLSGWDVSNVTDHTNFAGVQWTLPRPNFPS